MRKESFVFFAVVSLAFAACELGGKFEPPAYTVEYNANGGSGSMDNSSHIYGKAKNLNPNAFYRGGYSFAGGWAGTPDGAVKYADGQSVKNLAEKDGATVTLYAVWRSPYTVTFNNNGGDTEANPRAKPVIYPATTVGSLPEPPTRAGYAFAGWNTQANGNGTAFDATTTVTGNITVYAQWGYSYTVTFDRNGGDTEAYPQTKTVAYPATTVGSLPEPPTRAGYAFTGWNTAANGNGTAFTAAATVTGNITVYAVWIEGIVSAIGAELVRVPGGSFEMGQNGDGSSGNETPVHTVTLTGFYMGRTEVTQSQYQAVMGSNPASGYGVGDNYPVYYVSWYDALVFCNKLSIMEGLTPAYRINNSTDPSAWGSTPTSSNSTWNAVTVVGGSTGYRLPTEAQWEYAAKGGNGSPENYTYSGSNNPDEVAWYSNNSGSGSVTHTHTVGTKAPNGLGLYDMSGNMWEWCWDWYGDYSSGTQTDPTGASWGPDRVRRGGGWYSSAEFVRSAVRGYNVPNSRDEGIGFRLARPVQ